jgi:hypothetical protein
MMAMACLPFCDLPIDSSTSPTPSPPPSLMHPSLPRSASKRRRLVDHCIGHRFEEIIAKEHNLDLTMVAVVGGTKSSVTIVMVRHWLSAHFDILSESIKIKRYHPKDFLIIFSFYDDMLWMLHETPSMGSSLILIFKQWHHQALASAKILFYRVTVEVGSVPAHAWHLSLLRKLLPPTCSSLQSTQMILSKVDMC